MMETYEILGRLIIAILSGCVIGLGIFLLVSCLWVLKKALMKAFGYEEKG